MHSHDEPDVSAGPAGSRIGRATVFPDLILGQDHLSQLYAGLFRLYVDGEIDLAFSGGRRWRSPQADTTTLWLELEPEDGGPTRALCFDMHDAGRVSSMERLKRCDAYLKRSYDPEALDGLDPDLARKVRPFGLNYGCTFDHPIYRAAQARLYLRRHLPFWLKQPKRELKLLAAPVLRSVLDRLAPAYSPNRPLPVEAFEVQPDRPARPQVFMQSRIWAPGSLADIDDAELERLNRERVDTVRALRDAFGPRFVGGLISEPYARATHPDLVSPESNDRRHYLGLIAQSAVCVSTIGLHRSTPWKIPEYLAASRAVVSTPLAYNLPTPLEDERHLLYVSDPEACVTACAGLLDDPERRAGLRRNAFAYYRTEARPDALMRNRLIEAVRPE